MFPKSKIDFAQEFAEHFQADVEAAEKALLRAQDRLTEATRLRDDAEENLRRAINAADDEADSEATDDDDSTMQIGPGPQIEDAEYEDVDPITGEVETPVASNEWDERPCQDCGGEGRLPDRTGGGHHKCRACDGNGSVMVKGDPPPVVVVLYPGDDDPHVTEIGDRTRYAELVADYFTAVGIDAEVDADEWQVLAEDELTTNGGGGRNLTAPIQERDYGRRLIVAAAEQGSVVGSVAS
jgi:hypothetical protein